MRDVWVGQDGRIHRLRYVYQLGPVSGGGTMESVIDFSEFGEPLRLGIPPDRQVVRVEDVRVGDAA